MKTTHAVTSSLLLTVAALVYGLVLYPTLPERVPIHWNLYGQVDGWSGKLFAVLFMPGIMLVLLLMLAALPWLSPRNFKIDDFRGTYNYVMLIVIALMGYMHIMMLQAGLHPDLDMGKWLVAGLFLFFALIGNVLGKVRRNFWLGVRTPWTLANDTVWNATHRIAARLMVAGGLLGALAIWLGVPVAFCFILLLVISLVPVLYSLVLYKKMEGHS